MGWNDWIRTVEIAPSLTNADPVEALARAGCRVFHIDGDLDLAAEIAPLVHRYGGVVEVALADGESVSRAIAGGVDSVTLTDPSGPALAELRAAGLELGVAYGDVIPADISLVSVAVDDSQASLDRVTEVAASLQPGVCLEVVGDLGHESVLAFYEAGARVIVVGSSILEREDLPRAYRRLVQALA
ncbi:MAG TPA: hypothetical protein VG652_11470 [Gaiellaceae bacterium]|nr:hypothetical protein [Gaiellaceae bacterium]